MPLQCKKTTGGIRWFFVRLCCHFFRLSSHLQMQWQVTPAATALTKEIIKSHMTMHPPFLLSEWV